MGGFSSANQMCKSLTRIAILGVSLSMKVIFFFMYFASSGRISDADS